ncbi:MAG: hypothetical protein JST68_17735, partial [Bacteroidetes bacterium]|nr:hypothetical protein [Bacteroidota bacterium]
MPRRILYINLFLLVAVSRLPAQVSITVPQANITSGTAYTTTLPSGSYTGLGVAQTIRLQGSSPILQQVSTGSSFPVTNLGVQMSSLNGVSLLGSTTPINLTTSAQSIYSALAMTSGAIQLTYTIPMTGYGWVAGNYTTTLAYSLASTLLGNSTTGPGLLTVTIPAFITAPATLPTFTLNVNNLNFYSTQTVSASGTMAETTTVPYYIGVRGNSSFSYSNTLGLSTPSNLSLGNVNARLNSNAAVGLSGSNQNLSSPAISVSGGNNQTQTLTFSIAPAGMLGQFIQTGTYTVPLTITTADATTPAALVGSQTTTSTLTVNVADMQSIVVNDAFTDVSLGSVTAYQNGVSTSKTGHITVSSTSPWTL